MKLKCACLKLGKGSSQSLNSGHWVRFGSFYRRSDSKWIRRWRCSHCGKTISQATGTDTFLQKRRRLNDPIYKLLCSGVSQRRVALILRTNRKTVTRKFLFLAKIKKRKQEIFLKSLISHPISRVQFDEMETHEHSKWKPLSIALMVSEERKILGFEVSKMPARGKEALKAQMKYGNRPDERGKGLGKLFTKVQGAVCRGAEIRSDEKTLYPGFVRKYFPESTHRTFKGRRGCVAGQGELKIGGRDPLFKLNHTAAMLRANMNRLIRRTWCSTKKISSLTDHLHLYVSFHNEVLLNQSTSTAKGGS